MAIRIPSSDIAMPSIESVDKPLVWHTLKCELVTPMYGGGVKSTVVDESMPIRASSIRGQLRFWWRLLAKYKWNIGNGDPKKLSKAEFALWGGMSGDDDKDGQASQVLLKVKYPKENKVIIESWAKYEKNKKGKDVLIPKKWADVPYALFPAQGRPKSHKNGYEKPHSLVKEGLKWNLQFAFSDQLRNDEDRKNQVIETLRWWTNFGGVGSRTRRGLGAFKIENNNYFNSIVKDNEIKELGFYVEINQSKKNTAADAWIFAIKSLKKFRQVGEGRNDSSSRSHWPEPDAIRHHTKQSLPKHAERKTQGNFFPRAAFGLPIIFKFKDGGSSKNHDPDKATLKINYKKDGNTWKFERMSSPLILRPYLDDDGEWHAMALLLPEPLKNVQDLQLMLDGKKVSFWNESFANEIKPIEKTNKTDPLQAFLTYFKNFKD